MMTNGHPSLNRRNLKPGVIFEPEVIARLVALKQDWVQDWVNLRTRIKRKCPDVSYPRPRSGYEIKCWISRISSSGSPARVAGT